MVNILFGKDCFITVLIGKELAGNKRFPGSWIGTKADVHNPKKRAAALMGES